MYIVYAGQALGYVVRQCDRRQYGSVHPVHEPGAGHILLPQEYLETKPVK